MMQHFSCLCTAALQPHSSSTGAPGLPTAGDTIHTILACNGGPYIGYQERRFLFCPSALHVGMWRWAVMHASMAPAGLAVITA